MTLNTNNFLESVKSLISSKYPDVFKDCEFAEYLVEQISHNRLNIMVTIFNRRLKIRTAIFKCKHHKRYFLSKIKLYKLLEYYYDNINKNIPLNS